MPRFNGIQAHRTNRYFYRMADPGIDRDESGRPVHPGYCAIVPVRKCPIVVVDGREYRDPSNVPSIPLAHGGASYGYGRWKRSRKFSGWTCPVYFVRDGRVYVGRMETEKEPREVRCRREANTPYRVLIRIPWHAAESEDAVREALSDAVPGGTVRDDGFGCYRAEWDAPGYPEAEKTRGRATTALQKAGLEWASAECLRADAEAGNIPT